MQVSVIVPAFNEADRIGQVLEALHQTRGLSEIIVVDDASTDGTLEKVPTGNSVRSLRLARNSGKGAALSAGAKMARSEVLLFMDADLVGVKPQHIEALLVPVVSGQAQMSVAVFHGGRWNTDLSQWLVPQISGQRALRRDFFLSLSGVEKARYGIETAMTREASRRGFRVQKVAWSGVTHVTKEEKLGLLHGAWERMKMYREIGVYLLGFGLNGKNGHLTAASPQASAGKRKIGLHTAETQDK